MREVFRSPDGSYRRRLRDDDEEERGYLGYAARFHSPKLKFSLRILGKAPYSYSMEKQKTLQTRLQDYMVERMKDRPECPKGTKRICDCKFGHLSQACIRAWKQRCETRRIHFDQAFCYSASLLRTFEVYICYD